MPFRRLVICLTAVLVTATAAAEPKGPDLRRASRADNGDGLRATIEREYASAKANEQALLVLFSADWCSPCKMLKKMLRESTRARAVLDDVRIVEVDVDLWRPEAHELFDGIELKRLPVIVQVTAELAPGVHARGSELGLLSEADTGANLARLARGDAVQRPAYKDDPLLYKKLVREKKKKARTLAP